MPSAPAAAAVLPESSPSPTPSPPRKCRRVRSPLANGSAAGDFELRHWRTPPKRARSQREPGAASLHSPWAPPEIEIPCGEEVGRGGYTSLRDILSSPEYAASCSPAACGGARGGGGSCGDIHMIRHPLVKHAAYAYLQMTPSARDDPDRRRRRRRWRGPLCRLLLGCLSFIGALFRP